MAKHLVTAARLADIHSTNCLLMASTSDLATHVGFGGATQHFLVERCLASPDLLHVGHGGMLFSLEDGIDFLERLSFCLDPKVALRLLALYMCHNQSLLLTYNEE